MNIKSLFVSFIVLTLVFSHVESHAQVVYPQFEYKNYSKPFTYFSQRTSIFGPVPDYTGQSVNDLMAELNARGAEGWELISFTASPQVNNLVPGTVNANSIISYSIFLKRKTGIENVNAKIDSLARQYVDAAVAKIQSDLIGTIDTTIHSVLKPQLIQTIKDDITTNVKANFTSALAKVEAEIAALAAKH